MQHLTLIHGLFLTYTINEAKKLAKFKKVFLDLLKFLFAWRFYVCKHLRWENPLL